MKGITHKFYNHRRQGSVYLIVLSVSMMVTVIGLASLFAVRVQRRSAEVVKDCAEARLCAQSTVELGLYYVSSDSNWRTTWPNGTWVQDQPLGSATFTLEGIDPDDGVLNDSDMDPLVLIGTGQKGLARQKMQVRLVAEVRALSCLEVALHAQNDISFNSATVNCDQTISANNSVNASSSTINSDAEAAVAVNGGTYNGTTTFPVPAKEMPDSSVFDFYTDLANGTYIDIASLPLSGGYRYMEVQVLSPNSNPYGAPDADDGIYVIDCTGEKIAIQNCRIVGTLVLLNPAACEVYTVNWEPAVANYPALMVQGSAEFYCDVSGALEEGPPMSFNFNPPGTPYPYPDGESDTVNDDTYPIVIKGLVYISGDVNTWQSPAFDGVVVVGNTMTANTSLDLTYESTFLNNPPPGFRAPVQMKISPGSYKQVVD